MNKFFCYLIAFSIIPISLTAAPNFPFPQNVKYPSIFLPSKIDNSKVQKAFEDFMKLYEESPDKTTARIKHDTEANTVSEGIGYGMILLVYMDNATNNTKDKFDKLWAYYNKFLDTRGLMNWKISGFSGPTMDGRNAATDADLDVALALLEAYKQWGDEKYLKDAQSLIAKIAKYEVDSINILLNPGDTWGGQYNPSYFSTGALPLFKYVSDYDWTKVITNSYSLIQKCADNTTGLVQDWCTLDGNTPAMREDKYYYDATRTPWRIAWAYVWHGHPEAKEFCSKIASWISTKTGNDPSKIVDGYKRDGTELGKYNNATFVGPFACAGLVDSIHQTWLDKAYSRLNELVDVKDIYYQQSIKVLTLLLLTGNMPDFWSTTTIRQQSFHISAKNAPVNLISFNSFNRELNFSLTTNSPVTISIHTLDGRVAAKAIEGYFPEGKHNVTLREKIRPGAYIVNLKTSSTETAKKATIIR